MVDGHCTARIFAVGDSTEFGKVAQKSVEKSTEETPLNKQLDKLAKFCWFCRISACNTHFSMLFIKDIFLGETNYTLGEIGLLGAVIAGLVVAITKIWIPAIYDGLAVLGAKVSVPEKVSESGWVKWFAYGISTTVIILAPASCSCEPYGSGAMDIYRYRRPHPELLHVSVTLIVVAVPRAFRCLLH